MLHVPVNEWGLTIHSTADGTRPITTMGTSVTPAQNAYGSYATLISGANLTDDAFQIDICINSINISGSARDGVVSLGLDASGGTSFTSIADLICGPASNYRNVSEFPAGGVWYRFPLRIKSGTSIGVAAAVNSATLTALSVFCRVRCRPTRPEAVYAGSYIDQFGVTLASSNGTAITPGTTGEGTWTAIGSALTRPLRWLEFGYGVNNGTMVAESLDVDIGVGDASNKKIVISNQWVLTTTNEAIVKMPAGMPCRAETNDILYARAQASGTPESGHSVAIYGVGG